MKKPQLLFKWLEKGTAAPLYSVYAINEKAALKKLNRYLLLVGRPDIELVKVN